MTEDLIGQLGYFGIILVLVLGGLGLPVPEEAPVILAAILSRRQSMYAPTALASCFVGVLLGDFVVYFLGYVYGEKVLGFRLTRKFLTKAREAQIKGYFHRHGTKILILGRFAVGFRTAAYLTAGILRLPPLRLLVADLFAVSLTTLLMFGMGYWFADWIEKGLREVKHYLVVVAAAAIAIFLVYRYYKGRQRSGQPVGPPVPETDEVPIPVDDLHAPRQPSAMEAAAELAHTAVTEAVADCVPHSEPQPSARTASSPAPSDSAASAGPNERLPDTPAPPETPSAEEASRTVAEGSAQIRLGETAHEPVDSEFSS